MSVKPIIFSPPMVRALLDWVAAYTFDVHRENVDAYLTRRQNAE